MTADAPGRVGRRATSTGTFGTAAIRRRFAAQRDFGPFDAEDLDAAVGSPPGLLDFGSIRVPVPEAGTVTVEPTANGRLQAVHVALPGGRLSVSALAAPKSSGLWAELVAEIDSSLREGGARVRSFQGDWGRELHAQTGAATSVFVGVDGARWMLYGVATGPERHAVDLDAALRQMLKGTIVDRGRSPFPVRTVLPLTVPEELADSDVVDDSAAGVPGPPAPPARPSLVPPAARRPAAPAGPVPVRAPAPVVPRRIDAPTVIRPVTAFPPAASAPAPVQPLRPADRRPVPPTVPPRAPAAAARNEARTPDTRMPDHRTSDARTSDARTPDRWTPDRWTPEPDPGRPAGIGSPPADPTQALPVARHDRPDETPVPLWAAPAGYPADGELGPDPTGDPYPADLSTAGGRTRDDAATEWWPALGEVSRPDAPRTDGRSGREPGPWSAADPWAAAAPLQDDPDAAVREAPAGGRRRARDDVDDGPSTGYGAPRRRAPGAGPGDGHDDDRTYGAPNHGLPGAGYTAVPVHGAGADPAPTEWWPALPPEEPGPAPRRARHGSPDAAPPAAPAFDAVAPEPRSGRRRRADDEPAGAEATLDLAALVRDRPGRRRSRYEPEPGGHGVGDLPSPPPPGRRTPPGSEPPAWDRPASAWTASEHGRGGPPAVGFDPLSDPLSDSQPGWSTIDPHPSEDRYGWSTTGERPGRRRAPEPAAATDPVPAVDPAPRRRRSVDVPPDPDWAPPSSRDGRPRDGSAPALAFLDEPVPRPGRHHRPR